MDKKKVASLLSVLAIASCGGGAVVETNIDFSELETDQYIYNDSSFVSKGFTFSVGEFYSGGGDIYDDGYAYLAPDEDLCHLGYTSGFGETMTINYSNVHLSPLLNVSKISLFFIDFSSYESGINIEINGELVKADAFRDVFGTTIGGVEVSQCLEECDDADIDGGGGRFALEGPITSFSLGGEYLCIFDMSITQQRKSY